jgi:uncharacterized protein YcfJ
MAMVLPKALIVPVVAGVAIGMVAHQQAMKQGKGKEFHTLAIAVAVGAVGHSVLARKGLGPFGGSGLI